jgi:hypothetical protein
VRLTSEDDAIYRSFNSLFVKYFMGNDSAIQFCNDIVYIAHLWDDLIDCDKERSPHDINMAFTAALGTVQLNPFYQDNIKSLAPLMMAATLKWQAANVLEHGSDDQKFAAFMIRGAFVDIILFCLYLIGGYAYSCEAGPKLLTDLSIGITNKYAEFMEEMSEVD